MTALLSPVTSTPSRQLSAVTGAPQLETMTFPERLARSRHLLRTSASTVAGFYQQAVERLTQIEQEMDLLMRRYNDKSRFRGRWLIAAGWGRYTGEALLFGAPSITWTEYSQDGGPPRRLVKPGAREAERRYSTLMRDVQVETVKHILDLNAVRLKLRTVLTAVVRDADAAAKQAGPLYHPIAAIPRQRADYIDLVDERRDVAAYGESLIDALYIQVDQFDQQLDIEMPSFNGISPRRDGALACLWQIKMKGQESPFGPWGPFFHIVRRKSGKRPLRVKGPRGDLVTRDLIRRTYLTRHEDQLLQTAAVIETIRRSRDIVRAFFTSTYRKLSKVLQETA